MITDNQVTCDQRIIDLLPHRPPMLLINKLVLVNEQQSCAQVIINQHSAFFSPNLGVPNWIGIEYMGQTAALIAGYQLENGIIGPHLGFLLGTRNYQAYSAYFTEGLCLNINCKEKASIGDGLATFDCSIESDNKCLAEATLTVFRKHTNTNERSHNKNINHES
ncbi:MAG: 3-hydroxydecanoyl-ACP dehydratase [Gammaproteobacteria bacterium]|nr:3-hydroxydecanoyl-ACP dehydratase [Gammaproteobacteria bacterium]